ncbi:MAG TPA: pyruvate dehydrogenase complex dihydrolipoamide acetyltransferase [Saprospiraceae bacterium]|nr:pyruvate dehydrogenase complex dihydrolipoamide acetyltransferase [Saprospiraceae bacterium]WKZ63220.1 MAG: pyruvate dehydrogenase complex dihydrolipoamide acetyltransferase [Saprospiraceae bacterium]HPB54076.1 pyruvate dehydrogenase complex dihydrolipoamide acetyltransferase [Saprospiraceae bacterium]HPE10528.1 pyruvate dehydrogenase complex dihydrolipoamide acetyltransferase [Saprospiraceae bacterium]HRP85424.1 pyruvate dehydrogenase complex dihydrolipoamide acetyltransferase [Saprospirace
MAQAVTMPRLSDTMEEGNIVRWLKNVGDKVSPGDALAEVETDKATMDLESFFEGYLLHIAIPEGPVAIGALLGVIGKEGEDISAILAGNIDSKTENKPSTPEAKSDSGIPQTVPAQVDATNDSHGRIKASPLAKAIATEKGIDLSKIEGSGDGGRIIKHDVENYQIQPGSSTQTSTPIRSAGQAYKDIPLSQVRKTIARRLSESKFGAPHFYLTIEVDMEHAIAAREALNKKGDVKISYNDLVTKATALSLAKHPQVNSSWMNDFIRENYVVNIGVAVAVPDGLLVPVVRDANFKTLSELNQEIKTLAAKAKEKKLSLEEMQGNTFTISNLGMFDIDNFTAIINPPDACILAVGSIVSKPVVKNGAIVPGNTMKLTLSCDHRVVDGAVGAQFLQTLKSYLEQPLNMLL